MAKYSLMPDQQKLVEEHLYLVEMNWNAAFWKVILQQPWSTETGTNGRSRLPSFHPSL